MLAGSRSSAGKRTRRGRADGCKWKKAAELYDELTAAQPKDPSFLHRAGELYRKIDKDGEAATR